MEARTTTPQTTRTNRSYVDYLEDIGGGESEDEDLKRLDTSGGSSTDMVEMSTPQVHTHTDMVSPQPTEPHTFVDGLLSPFSPLLKQEEQREEFLKYLSLQPCRKVSVVVRILPCDDDKDAKQQRCVFPHIKSNNQNAVIRKPNAPRNMVVVNPSAFGKYIPSHVTMDTARLVAQVAHISSEDWARLYEFHHVMWPPPQQKKENRKENNDDVDEFSTIDSLSRAVTQDALVENQSSLLISLGQGNTCMGSENGLWPRVISHCQAWMEEQFVCTLTMFEVLEEKDSFRDLLNRKNKDISLRHVDMKGAVLEGLTQAPIDSMSALLESLLKRKKSSNTVIGTLNIWSNAVSFELKKTPNAQITCVELAAADVNVKRPGKAIVHRNSTMCLGQALRQLLLHSSFGTEPAISFRDTSLTKVLQRSLESSKIVLLASVSQLSKDYEPTLATLNYLRRLLVKPGQTASSPFKANSIDEQLHQGGEDSSPQQLSQYADDRYILEKLISDPRQRLAKIFKKSPPQKPNVPSFQTVQSEDDYQPIDYMKDWDRQAEFRKKAPKAWETPPAKRQSRIPKASPQMSRRDPDRRGREQMGLEPERKRNIRDPIFPKQHDATPEYMQESERQEKIPQPIVELGSTSPHIQTTVNLNTTLEPDSDRDEVREETIQHMDFSNQEEVQSNRNQLLTDVMDQQLDHQNYPDPFGIHVRDPPSFTNESNVSEEEEIPPHHRDQLVISNDNEPSQTQGFLADDRQEMDEEQPQQEEGIEWDLQYGRDPDGPNSIDTNQNQSADFPPSSRGQSPVDVFTSNLEYSETEHANPDENESNGERALFVVDQPFHSANEFAASNDIYERGNGVDQDTGRSFQPEDSSEHKVREPIQWIPDVSDENKSDGFLGGEVTHVTRGNQENKRSHVDVDTSRRSFRNEDSWEQEEKWPIDPSESDGKIPVEEVTHSTAENMERSTESLLDENHQGELQETTEQTAFLIHDNMECKQNQLDEEDVEEVEIYFEEAANSFDTPEIHAENRGLGEHQLASDSNHRGENYSDDYEGLETSREDPEMQYNENGATSHVKDTLNSSLFDEWGADHTSSDGDDLDLEPQTQYELPESPRPTPDGCEEEDWYVSSPQKVDDENDPSLPRATTPRSSNREKFYKRTFAISTANDTNGSKPKDAQIQSEGNIKEPISEFSTSFQSTARHNHTTISSRSAFSSVAHDGIRPPPSGPSSGQERYLGGPEQSSPEIRSNLFASTPKTAPAAGMHPTGVDHLYNGGGDQFASSPFESRDRVSIRHTHEDIEGSTSSVANKEIDNLESFVSQIQDMHKGLWKSSALSLHRLKESLQSQGGVLGQLVSERENLLSEIAEVREESRRTSKEFEGQVQHYEDEVHKLRTQLDKAMADKVAVEKIADEAISSQDTLERRVNSLHEELNASRMKTEFTREEVTDLKESIRNLRQSLQETTSDRDKLEASNQDGTRKRIDLERSLKTLQADQLRSEKTIATNKSSIEDLKLRLKQREVETEKLKEENQRLERFRQQDRSQMEGVVGKSRNLGASLESMRKERSRLEEERRDDKHLIKEQQDELRSVKQLYANLESEYSKCHDLQVEKEARFDTMQSQYREVRLQLESLQVNYDKTVESKREQIAESEHMQREIKRLKSTINGYELEKSRLQEIRRDDQTKIRRLESDMRGAGSKNEETIQRLEKEISRQKQENEDLENRMAKKIEEYADNLKGKDDEIARFKELSDSIESDLTEAERKRNELESELSQLRISLREYETELDLCIRQRDDFALKLESMEESNLTMTTNIEKKERQLKDSEEETRRLKEEFQSIQDEESSRAAAAERELERIKMTRSELETKLSDIRQQRDDARNDLHKESLSRQSLRNELEITKDNLKRQQDAVEQLSRDLQRSRAEKSSDDQRVYSMESSLNRFRSETKEKLDKVVRDHNGSKELLERERNQNRNLEDQIRVLRSEYRRVKRERDACLNSLEAGRSRLAMMATNSKSVVSISGNGELHLDEPHHSNFPTGIEFHRQPHMEPVEELPELYLTDFSTDELASLRAEVASLRAEEASHLRSQVYRLEEEKESEVASLKTKIRHLESQVNSGDAVNGRSNNYGRSRNAFDPN